MTQKIIILFFLLFTACQNKNILSYEVIFEGKLGFNQDEIGSNKAILSSYSNRRGLPDQMLLDIPQTVIHDERLYVADSYNKRISVFSLQGRRNSKLLLSISNQGVDYSFSRPYLVHVDNQRNIYVLASIQDIESYEVQNYSNQTAQIQNYNKFQEDLNNISLENFFLYKFSSQGEFLYKMGATGIDSRPMVFPYRLSGDIFGNVYVTIVPPLLENEDPFFTINRYSPKGDLNFEFSSEAIKINTNINDVAYQGKILALDHFRTSEKLLTLTEYQPITNSKGESVPPMIDNIWSALSVYSLLENEFVETIFTNKTYTESILGVDDQDDIILQSYDNDIHTLKINIYNSDKKRSNYFFTPIYSSHYNLFDYFIDSDGNIYNSLVDRDKFIILKWNTKGVEK